MTTTGSSFGGDRKEGEWFLATAERRMVSFLVPKVPGFLETYHLTMMHVYNLQQKLLDITEES